MNIDINSDLGESFGNWSMADDLALPGMGTLRAPRPADHPRAPQMTDQLAFQSAPGLDEQGQVDRLVRHPHSVIVREQVFQPARDLFRRPIRREPVRNQIPE